MRYIGLWLLLISSLQLSAQSSRKYVNEFMYVGTGARQFGMGKTGAAGTSDVYSTYWNPAGLAEQTDKIQVGFMHNFYFQNIANFDYLTLGIKSAKNKVFGFSVLRFGVDGILNTLDLIRNGEINYDRVTTFSASDYAFVGTYAQQTRPVRKTDVLVSWGGNVKLIHRKVGEFATAWGFGLDAGFKIRDYKGKWGFGVNARDITTTFNSWNFTFTNNQKDILYLTGNTIPKNSLELALPRFNAGGYYRFTRNKFELLGEANLEITTDGERNTLLKTGLISADPRLGIEAGIREDAKKFRLMVRAGVSQFQRETRNNGSFGLTMQPSTGIGVEIDRLRLDYALAGFGASGTGLYSNIISLNIGINGQAK